MTVAFDASSEFNAGTSATPNPRTWTHTPVGTPKGVLVYAYVDRDNVSYYTAADYGGVAMTLVSGGAANDTAGELGTTITFFLGSGIPTGAQTVSVTHIGTVATKWFHAVTVTAAADTEIVGTPVLLEDDGGLGEQNVDSGAVSALRFAGGWWGGSNVPAAGANSTAVDGNDFGSLTLFLVRETTAGSGSRPVGVTTGDANDDRAIVHLAVAEVAGGSPQNLTGTLFTKAPTFFTGTVTSTRALTGSLFTKAPTFFTGVVTPGVRTLTGSLFTKAPTFPTGVVTATRALTGTLFQKAPTFFAGTVTTGAVTLTGTLFVKAPTFPTGAVSLAASPQTVNGLLFTKTPAFPQGAVASTYALTGTLFVKAPTFFAGTVTTGGVTLTGVLFAKAPTFPQGVITSGSVTLTGVLFQSTPTFPTGAITAGTVTLTGVLFQKAPTFPTGTIGQAGTLFGTLFQNTPVFFTGTIAQGAPSFWTPNPAGYTVNPVAFVRVGRAGPSPWGIQLSGHRFEKAPSFPTGTVT